MKIKLKTLKQQIYEIEVSDDNTRVSELKEIIETKYSYESKSIKLLFNGIVLDDNETLSFYSIKEGSIVILMISKVQKKLEEKNKEEANNNTMNSNLNSNINVSTTNQANLSMANSNINTSSQINSQTDNNKNIGNNYENQLKQLLEMGFDADSSKNAINVAKGSVPIAIEYLYNGIPPNLSQTEVINMNQEDNFVEPDDLYDEGNNDGNQYLNIDMFDGINLQDPNALKNICSVIKVIIKEDPSALQDLLLDVEEVSPEIFDFIKENETQFKNEMSIPVSENDYLLYNQLVGGANSNQNPNSINNHLEEQANEEIEEEEEEEEVQNDNQAYMEITKDFNEKDHENILELVGMGFDRIEAVQAYLAFDKNLGDAANFLLQDKNN